MTTTVRPLVRVRRLAATGEARRLREAARLTTSEVAAACGVTASTVSRWECGHRSPRGDAALAYDRLLASLQRDNGAMSA